MDNPELEAVRIRARLKEAEAHGDYWPTELDVETVPVEQEGDQCPE